MPAQNKDERDSLLNRLSAIRSNSAECPEDAYKAGTFIQVLRFRGLNPNGVEIMKEFLEEAETRTKKAA